MRIPPDHEAYPMFMYIENELPALLSRDTPAQVPTTTDSLPTAPPKPLPEILSFCELTSSLKTEKKPEAIIEGVLHRGARGCISGSSKAGKTWSLINLAAAVATGGEWLGFTCRKSKVLYLDFELMPWFGKNRFRMVKDAIGLNENLLNNTLFYWSLRDHYISVNDIIDHLTIHGLDRKFDLIILDPYYKMSTGMDENSAAEVSAVLRTIGEFSSSTGAAFFYSHHFSKGNKADVDSIDRASGSGVFARDPDAILTMTSHEEEDCLVVEPTLRNGPAVPSAVVEVDFPVFKPRPDLDPQDLKKPKQGRARSPSAAETLVRILEDKGGELGRREWQRACEEEGVSEHAFNSALSELTVAGRLATNDLGPGKSKIHSLRGSV